MNWVQAIKLIIRKNTTINHNENYKPVIGLVLSLQFNTNTSETYTVLPISKYQ